MKKYIKIIVGLLSLTIVLIGTEVEAAKNGCYCSSEGTVQSEVDVTQLKGFIKVDTEDKCQLFSKDTNSVTGAPSYHYCTWYQEDVGKTSWKTGVVTDLSKKNGCYCKKGSAEVITSGSMDSCSNAASNPGLGYSNCNWYINDQVTKVFTVQNTGKCIAINEGNTCKNIPLSQCGTVSDSPCVSAFPLCKVRDDINDFCSKMPKQTCQSYAGFCTWQEAGTDINKPEKDPYAPQVVTKTHSTFDATVLNKLGTTDVKVYVARIIKGAMGILGSITLVMFVYSGILFMTDRGAGENVGKAKEIAVWTTLGLGVIFASYAIINFIFQIFAL